MTRRFPIARVLTTILLAGGIAALAACNGSGSSSTGSMSLAVTDTPVDSAQSVVVAFTGVTLHGPSGTQTINFSQEKTINLLNLQGNASATLLPNTTVDAGQYQWIRLNVDLANSYIVTDTGAQYPLTIPSGSQSGLKLVSGFTVAQGSQMNFMIDFDLRKSLTMAKNGSTGAAKYILKPALRLINMQQVGSIAGSAAATMTINGAAISNASCAPAVYVYTGTNVTLAGYDVTTSGGATPLTSATLKLNNTTGNYDYTVGFLAPGGYTLAVTCAANDTTSPGAATLAFSAPATATVMANATTTVNFPVQ